MAKKTPKVPKTIAGVKVPKPLRRALRELAASESGRAVLAEALTAAAAAIAATKARPATADETPGIEQVPDALGQQPSPARSTTAAALEDAARSFTESLRRRSMTETPPQTTTPSPSPSTH